MEEFEKAYWAGFTDGEGCIEIKKQPPNPNRKRTHPSYILNVAISNTKPEVLLKLLPYGASINITIPRGNKRKQRPRYIAFIGCKKAREFLMEIYPYLVIKKEEAEIALTFQSMIDSYSRGIKINDEEVEKRERLYRKLRKAKEVVPDPEEIRRILTNLGKRTIRYWTRDEEKIIIKYAPDWDKLFAMLKHRTRDSIINRAYYLGLDTTKKGGHYAKWLREEEEILKKWLDEGMELEDVAKRLRRTWWAVRVRASRLNIAVP